jgi:chorismate-pyruvate lyase
VTRVGPPVDAGLPAVLRRNQGSLTALLERLAREPVDAEIRAQSRGQAPGGDPLGLAAGSELMQRAVLLRGRVTGRDYVYAETSIAPARIPTSVRQRLEETRDPIGRVLNDHRLVVGREPLPEPATASHTDASTAAMLTAAVFSRRYRILLGTVPAFTVDEWFLGAAADVLGSPPNP